MSNSPNNRASRVLVTLQAGVATVTINRPKVLNALDLKTRIELGDAFNRLSENSQCQVIILRGHSGNFSSGGDIRDMASSLEQAKHRLQEMNKTILSIMQSPKPVIAAVDGVAHGVGMSLVCACDLVVGSRSASFRAAFAQMGLGPDGGLSLTLPSRVGHHSRRLLMTAATIDADEALQIGLIDALAKEQTAEHTAQKLAQQVSKFSPSSIAAIKRLSPPYADVLHKALEAEEKEQVILMTSEESLAARSAFLEKRMPNITQI